MALIKCGECSGTLSTKAESCPHCGAVREREQIEVRSIATMEKGLSRKRRIFIVVGLFIAFLVFVNTHPAKTPSTEEVEQQALVAAASAEQNKEKSEDCKKNLQCWAEEIMPSASYPCKKAIEASTRYSFRWTDGVLASKFSQIRWIDQTSGKITFIGDSLEVQNMYGAYEPNTYECNFDPNTKAVISVDTWVGRL